MVTKDTLIQDIFIKFPKKAGKIAEFLSKKGIACVGCCASAFETLEEGLKGHNIEEKEIEKIIKEINKIIEE